MINLLMSWIWFGMLACSILFSVINGSGPKLAGAVAEGAQAAITLSISIAGPLCLWTGVGRLMEKAGVTGTVSKWIRPVLTRLFPSSAKDPELSCALSGNICANLLGLGNAATPMGLRAVKRLSDPKLPGSATSEMCRLVVLNTASIQLLPTTVAAVRAGLGCPSPFDILPAVWITSFTSAAAGLLAAKLLERR